jgi:hypothetical protein
VPTIRTKNTILSVCNAQLLALMLAGIGLAGCAGSGNQIGAIETDESAAVVSVVAPVDAGPAKPVQANEASDLVIYEEVISGPFIEIPITAEDRKPLIDRTQATVYGVVNSSTQWFDSFFGTGRVDQGNNVSMGSVTLGAQWDQRDGVEHIARMRARVPLNALRDRTRLVFGRGNVEEFVDGTTDGNNESLPSQFSDFEDDDWLLGIGYSRKGELSSGFDVGVGVKIASPLEPYVRTTYRWNHAFNEALLWQLRPRVFWQNQRGYGATVNSILDYAANSKWLLRTWTTLSVEDEIQGMGWTNNFIAYQSLTNRTALSYSLFASGETEGEVELQDYGVELRYRKRIAREYLFIELSTRLTWPRYLLEEKRQSNFGVGLAFEMQFGDWPGRQQRATNPAEARP